MHPLEFTKTQRGRDMLIYEGYRYVENRQSTKNKFWRCSRYVKYGCRATIVTSKNPDELSVRLAGLAHSHGPEKRTSSSSTTLLRDASTKHTETDATEMTAESDSDVAMAFDDQILYVVDLESLQNEANK